ncbi:MAG: hypothetical protein HYV27_00555 [Candidatus Hydrogenedentes bacterium]|nr:hypothetical protein [Candidatus Hydrogenedentota bacterium]
MLTLLQDIPLGPPLTEEAVRAIFALGEVALVFALLAQAKLPGKQQSQSAVASHDMPQVVV